MHYMDGYRYTPGVLAHYSNDLDLVHNCASKHAPMALVAADSERDFYTIVAARADNINLRELADQSAGTAVLTKAARSQQPVPETWQLEQIIASGRAKNADRLYVYKIP